MKNQSKYIIQVKCWNPKCDTPYFLTPSKDNYTVVAHSPDAGTFQFKGFRASEMAEVDESQFETIESFDYLVVYCDSNHKNYLPIGIN